MFGEGGEVCDFAFFVMLLYLPYLIHGQQRSGIWEIGARDSYPNVIVTASRC
jgi:hypothetical protein